MSWWRVIVWLVIVAGILATIFLLRGMNDGSFSDQPIPQAEDLAATPSPSLGPAMPARQALTELRRRGRSQEPGYERSAFGKAWTDTNNNACDTREDVLKRDLEQVEFRKGTGNCVVNRGVLDDPYTGVTMRFQRGPDTSPLVQIDHVVSLADAWDAGAWRWNDQVRLIFANDLMNLLAVQGDANSSKADRTADRWLPPLESAHCSFVARQIAVKRKYSLSITDREFAVMDDILATCPNEPLPQQ